MTTLSGVGPQLGRLIERVAGKLVVDLLWHLPSGFVDRRAAPSVTELENGSIVTLKLKVERHEPGMGRRPYRVICYDGTGFITLIYFNVKGDYLQRLLPVGAERIVSGRVEFYVGIPQIAHPDYVVPLDQAEKLKPIEPVYPLTAGLPPRVLQRAVAAAVERAPDLPEWIDAPLRQQRG
ncbi:MAG TPA: ATP-dependent DNA helicase RecG, partial [Stellaceae bacterium]|nr:ATP-dependent DNA helicase RecG [Stellaceae bacterium]